MKLSEQMDLIRHSKPFEWTLTCLPILEQATVISAQDAQTCNPIAQLVEGLIRLNIRKDTLNREERTFAITQAQILQRFVTSPDFLFPGTQVVCAHLRGADKVYSTCHFKGPIVGYADGTIYGSRQLYYTISTKDLNLAGETEPFNTDVARNEILEIIPTPEQGE